jgi:selenide, water dikinase
LLDSVLKKLPRSTDPNLLVGFETSDDAGVYQIADDLALVQTADFFTPIADDPFVFGQIAAANSLSDIYAMGGRPISSLSLVGFPPSGEPETLEQILRGGLEKMAEAGCTIVGGHSVRDEDLKFGYAVTGLIHPKKIWRNVGAQPGDALILTKPLGTGVISTALKQDRAEQAWVAASVASMVRLNRDAADAVREVENLDHKGASVHAVTDVTGFGLLGHAREMAIGSRVSLRLDHQHLTYLAGAIEAARAGFFSGGLKSNREFLEGCVEFSSGLPDEIRALLYDPQTSGGLLIAIAPGLTGTLMPLLKNRGISAQIIGSVLDKRSPLIEIV